MSLKTFELVPVVEKINLGGDQVRSSIECLESWQENLYMGTTDCFVVHYAVEQGLSPTGKINFRTKLQRHKHLGLRKPIKQLLACAAAGQLLVLCDFNVYGIAMYGLEMKQTLGKELLRGVTVLARNDRPRVFNPFEVQVCVGTKRKTVQVLNVLEDKLLLMKEVSLSEPPSVLAIDGEAICASVGSQYCMINYSTSVVQQLFVYEAHNTLPLVKRVGKEEFILSGPTNSMGMIVNSEGLAKHQPLTFPDGLRSIAFSYPYMLALGMNTVTTHSMLDQRQKQAVAFQGGILIGDFDGRVYIALQKSVMAFVPVPFDKQIQMLLIDKRVDEALDLAFVASRLDEKKYGAPFLRQIRAQAGFVYFGEINFKQAYDLFKESELDPRELIILHPDLHVGSSSFTASRPLLHNFKDLSTIVKGNLQKLAEGREFLLKYLEACRPHFLSAAVEVDTAIVKLYAELNHPCLVTFVAGQNACSVGETVAALTQFSRYHALALFHCTYQQTRRAMEIWKQLAYGDLVDQNFPGLRFVASYLKTSKDYNLIWDSMPWLLDKDQIQSAAVFTERSNEENDRVHFDADTVVVFLLKYPDALQAFLEDLIYVKKSDKEKFHTHLALFYANRVIAIMQDPLIVADDLETARCKFRKLLEYSSLYRVSAVLQRLGDHPLYLELAILYGKMDQHDKALKILVYRLRDFNEAERYCDVISAEKGSAFRRKVFRILLEVYLHPDEDGVRAEHLALPAAKLLNTRHMEFDPAQVISALPLDWSVDVLSTFLSGTLRSLLHKKRMAKVEGSLSRAQYVRTRAMLAQAQNVAVPVTEDSKCFTCRKPFTEPTIARYPNGVIVHVHCAKNKSVMQLPYQ